MVSLGLIQNKFIDRSISLCLNCDQTETNTPRRWSKIAQFIWDPEKENNAKGI